MQIESFPIIQILEEMILQDEPMGSKDKVWCQLPHIHGNDSHWLFKKPRQQKENIEHLTEKIAMEIAGLLELPCARVELAFLDGVRGTISMDVRSAGEVLVHGNEIVAGRVVGYNLLKERHTSDHTFERIRQGINEVCGARCEQDLFQFAGYLVFDALIGNTDRHHENWALLRQETGIASHRLAPSFDHASSLGRELQDARRQLLVSQNGIAKYIRKGWGAIYMEELGEQVISPMELVARLAVKFPGLFDSWFAKVKNLKDDQIVSIINRIPAGWSSDVQLDFIVSFIRETRKQLGLIET